jgi:3-keto-disaccharide hydrolase
MGPIKETKRWLWVLAAAAWLASGEVAPAQIVTFESETPGQPPRDFEFGLAGQGEPGRWEVLADPSAGGGKALAQLSTNMADFRFLVAMYKPVTAANVEVTTRCKPMSGQSDQACGVIVRATDAGNYYIARANALEGNVRFYRVRDGQREQLASAEGIKIEREQWHTLTLHARDDRFTVFFNDKPLHVTKDSTPEPRPADGRVGLWVKSDSVTYFDRLEIRKFP